MTDILHICYNLVVYYFVVFCFKLTEQKIDFGVKNFVV